jgi:hypothetical protein
LSGNSIFFIRSNLYKLDLIKKIEFPDKVIEIIRNYLINDMINSDIYQRYLKFLINFNHIKYQRIQGFNAKNNSNPSNLSVPLVPSVSSAPSELIIPLKYNDINFLNHYKSYLKILIGDKDELLERFNLEIEMRKWYHLFEDKYLSRKDHNKMMENVNLKFKNFKDNKNVNYKKLYR